MPTSAKPNGSGRQFATPLYRLSVEAGVLLGGKEMDFQNLRMTSQELDRLAWCHQNLYEENIEECEAEAMEFAALEVNAPMAYDMLLALLVEVLVRNARENGETL